MQAVKSLEDCIADISEWMGCNSLKINEDKTEFVIFSRNPDKYSDITLQIGTDNIKSSDYVKNYGRHIRQQHEHAERHWKYMSHNLHAYPENPKHQMLFE